MLPARPCKLRHTMRFGINTFLFTSPFTTQSVKLFPKFKNGALTQSKSRRISRAY
jgi:hypothetical protein